jgi:hypothetical protein
MILTGENPSWCHFLHHASHMDLSGDEPVSLR